MPGTDHGDTPVDDTVQIPTPDARAEQLARARQEQLTKPPGSLGRLEDLACWLAGRLRSPQPAMPRCELFVFAADHGVAAQNVSAFPQAVTAQMLGNFAAGGAAINVLTSLADCAIEVIDVGVASEAQAPPRIRRERIRSGTRDLSVEAAMSAEELTAALGLGERCADEAIRRGAQLLIAGDMGIANTTTAGCLICAFTGATPLSVVGRGTGLDDAALEHKRTVVTNALKRANAEPPPGAISQKRARQILQELGGLEIAAMTGLYIGAARRGVPILLDGYISGAAALAAVHMEPGARAWMLAGHRSAEAGHAIALQTLGLAPLLDLGLRLGEGTGAALSLSILRAALALHRGMATFAEAGVAEKTEKEAGETGRSP